jgi:hypothetical protein
VGLTESKIKDLTDKKFDKLYQKHEQEWVEITNNAYVAARDHVCGGNHPRHDDVLKMLLPMLEPNETLRKHQEENRAKYRRFREAYGDYMIDKFFAILEKQKNEQR